MKVVLASGNRKKLEEMKAILPSRFDLVSQASLDVGEAEETGLTFVENAIIKARHAARMSGLPAIADDSGLEVEVLKGAPGIYSARYAGSGATDADNNEKLLAELRDVPADERKARFQCVIVMLKHELDPTPVIAS
ncbi:MAG: non-canonical purine NTP pyrophosphatase, partial [Pseudomonadales bacterium]|nr:non-canonical purine NTP pyrophosphatase [Pseudomonadales bacterium]